MLNPEITDLMARDICAALRAGYVAADLIAAGWTVDQCRRFGDAALHLAKWVRVP